MNNIGTIENEEKEEKDRKEHLRIESEKAFKGLSVMSFATNTPVKFPANAGSQDGDNEIVDAEDKSPPMITSNKGKNSPTNALARSTASPQALGFHPSGIPGDHNVIDLMDD